MPGRVATGWFVLLRVNEGRKVVGDAICLRHDTCDSPVE